MSTTLIRPVSIHVTHHAVLRYMERILGLSAAIKAASKVDEVAGPRWRPALSVSDARVAETVAEAEGLCLDDIRRQVAPPEMIEFFAWPAVLVRCSRHSTLLLSGEAVTVVKPGWTLADAPVRDLPAPRAGMRPPVVSEEARA
ncbi:MAG: hypothetical protein NW215_10600 [Hyphomicrobiales bacterium]|nr:hypothetical protein [Hyphomicrobiales bacterium]